jgi:hypothetical protein
LWMKVRLQGSRSLSDCLLWVTFALRDSTMYNEYINFCALEGSRSSVKGVSNCLKPCNSVGLVGSRLKMSHTRLLSTWAFVLAMCR